MVEWVNEWWWCKELALLIMCAIGAVWLGITIFIDAWNTPPGKGPS